MKNLSNVLSQNGFWMVNKALAKALGSNDAALVLSHFVSLQEQVFGNKSFYQQQERILEECNITLYTLRQIVKTLKERDILTVTKHGMPAKYYYFVNIDAIVALLDVKETTVQEVANKEGLDLPISVPLDLPISVAQKKEKIKKEKVIKENNNNNNYNNNNNNSKLSVNEKGILITDNSEFTNNRGTIKMSLLDQIEQRKTLQNKALEELRSDPFWGFVEKDNTFFTEPKNNISTLGYSDPDKNTLAPVEQEHDMHSDNWASEYIRSMVLKSLF